MPGGSGVGPVSSLVTVLDAVMSDAADDGQHLLTSATARRLVSPHRVGLRDNVLANDLSWGLGFTVDSRAFCPRLSQRTFGHLGWHGCCIAFADPASGLAVGVAFDRLVDARSALLRHAAVVGAIVRDVQDAALV